MAVDLPSETSRLFPHYETPEQWVERSPGLLIGKVLEEGNQRDLRWLTRTYTDEDLRSWLQDHGHRLLTRRSRAFWYLLLGLPGPETSEPGELLWPL